MWVIESFMPPTPKPGWTTNWADEVDGDDPDGHEGRRQS